MNLSARLVACLVAFILITAMWLGFSYLMRDTALVGSILDVGSLVILVVGFALYRLARH